MLLLHSLYDGRLHFREIKRLPHYPVVYLNYIRASGLEVCGGIIALRYEDL